jgi:chromosome segregation ATPase
VTRVLKQNGAYYYLVQDKPVPKSQVTDVFKILGLNPDNSLIIMHQFMVGRFAAVSAQDKLRMLEEAVGFQSYREEVLDAKDRLDSVASEEQSLAQVLESTKETHDFWKREYDRFLQKKQLETRLDALKLELLWSRINKRKEALDHLNARIDSKLTTLQSIDNKLQGLEESKKKRQAKYDELNFGRVELENQLVELVKETTRHETNLEWATKLQRNFESILQRDTGQLIEPFDKLRSSWKDTADDAQKGLSKGKEKTASLSEKMADASGRLEDALTRLIDTKVEYEVSSFKKNLLAEDVRDLQAQVRLAREELDPMLAQAEKTGPASASPKKIMDIMFEIGAIEQQIRPLATISEDVEKMYSSYAKVYEDLRQKATQVAKNREEVNTELDKRLTRWRDVLTGFLEESTGKYNEILATVGAVGGIRLLASRDIENCGIEILVGFKGNKPTPLDAFTQSGGERSIAMMAFLLALQQHITSPFRAIDEFDVHMDPKNRELVTQLIIANSKNLTQDQYLAITPGQINVTNECHVIVVQNIEGSSSVSELKMLE